MPLLHAVSQRSDTMTRAGEGEIASQGVAKVKRSMKKCEACRARKIAVSSGLATVGSELSKFANSLSSVILETANGQGLYRKNATAVTISDYLVDLTCA
jgi:hypothetical protein